MIIRFVLPNLACFRSRGRLEARLRLATELGCQLIEIPADLVKNAREAVRTDRSIGEFLTDHDVRALYGVTSSRVPIILHTDPAIPRRDPEGRLTVPRLRWGERTWTVRYAARIAAMAEATGNVLEVVEMHPGLDTDLEGLATAMGEMSDALMRGLGRRPLVVMENKHRQRVARVEEMWALADLLPRNGRHGLVLDVANLWKTHRSRTSQALEDIPWEAVRGVHVHWKHRAPRPDDPMDWPLFFERLAAEPGPRFVNPEVFHLGELRTALDRIRTEMKARAGTT